MDIKDFDIKYIQEFSIFYHLVKSKFGKIVESDNIKRQNKIKKWMFKKCISEEYPKNIVDSLNTLNAKEFITFFKSCDEYIRLYRQILQKNKLSN